MKWESYPRIIRLFLVALRGYADANVNHNFDADHILTAGKING